jgi:hypothetical protein
MLTHALVWLPEAKQAALRRCRRSSQGRSEIRVRLDKSWQYLYVCTSKAEELARALRDKGAFRQELAELSVFVLLY